MKLKDLVADAKEVKVPFDGNEDFVVTISYVPRTEMTKMVKSCETTKMNRSTRQYETELDQEKFLKMFVERVVKDWEGLTLEILDELVPIDYEPEHANQELPFEPENALSLLKQSQVFDDWLNAKVNDISTFR